MKVNPIFFLLPNLVGYIRALLYITAFTMHLLGQWQLCIILYLIGFLLDELDGRVATQYNQKSVFGATLDMVLDRSATTGLCLILAQLYPAFSLVFILLIVLDISSHYYLLVATSIHAKNSHKEVESWSNSRLLNLYYGKKILFDGLITGNELFYCLVYISYYTSGISLKYIGINVGIWHLLSLLCFPVYCLKQVINVIQLQTAASKIAGFDLLTREGENPGAMLSDRDPNS